MKKLRLKRRSAHKETVPTRITNETVAEHRERILAGGRRFKYPMQYARHRLVITTVLISIASLILIVAVGWWQLYPVQNTNTFFYRVTRVLPLPVASVDGEAVRYSDYLMYYNGSAHWLQKSEQINLQNKDGKLQNDYIKRKSMDIAIANAYAAKLARGLHLSVSNDRVNQVTDAARNTATGRISQETYDASALSTLGWAPDEYRQDTKSRLLLQDVSYAIDSVAEQKADKAASVIKQGETDFDKLATTLGGEGDGKPTVGVSGLVPLTNDDGGLATAAAKLQKGQISPVIRTATGDGYYFVKLIDKNDTQVNYSYIRIPLTAFTKRLAGLRTDGKIHEYISIATTNQK
ncbi:MAG: SurA N-terminal domain-containing protein [Candidatus Saccharimonadales bacterium]